MSRVKSAAALTFFEGKKKKDREKIALSMM